MSHDIKFGTHEWAEKNINFVEGCLHNCLYCYSKEMAIRFHRKTSHTWKNESINKIRVNKEYSKYKGVIMFPSSHDITPKNVDDAISILKKLLRAENQVLVVSKPHLECIKKICDECKKYKNQILFRFTISSTNDEVLKFWEPGAPDFNERISCLQFAFKRGFNTSVSCEPMLDDNIEAVIEKTQPFVTETIWIGKINFLLRRLKMNGVTGGIYLTAANNLIASQNDQRIIMLHNKYKDNPKIKWKESIIKVISKHH